MVEVIFSSPDKCEKINGMKIVDMHCHTNLSDGRDDTDEIIKYAEKYKIGVSVTDHNSIASSVKVCKNIFSIPGIEVTSSDSIDLLAYFYNINDLEDFYNKHIKDSHVSTRFFNLWKLKWNTEELIDHIREYPSVIVLPHPLALRPKNSYEFTIKRPELIKHINAIEVINSLMRHKDNLKVSEWAKELKKPATGASDAHIASHLNRAVTASYAETVEEFLDNILNEKNVVVGRSLEMFSKIHAKTFIVARNLKW